MTPSATQHVHSPDDHESLQSHRHYSIDFSLDLERQLDMESQPTTPLSPDKPTSEDMLDPQVLTHIVVQLRNSIATVSKERDQLRHLLLVSQSHEASLKEAASLATEKIRSLEGELGEAREKIKDHEESITMLRSKVEESRRGLMRLQTESRRQSTGPATLDLSRAGLTTLAGPVSSKRASFTPLTGTFSSRPPGHRRVSSVSDSGEDTSPQPPITHLPDPHPPSSTRRFSGLFGRASPPQIELHDPATAELESLKREVIRLKEDLDSTRNDLTETIEAKEASESCVKALREFIAESSVGVGGTASDSPKAPTQGDSNPGGWGFKLWKGDTAKPPVSSPPGHNHTGSLSRKFGDFFNTRTASIHTAGSPPQSRTGVTRSSQRDSMYSFSDVSSVAEPISPTGEVNGNVIVRDLGGHSDTGSTSISPDPSKGVV